MKSYPEYYVFFNTQNKVSSAPNVDTLLSRERPVDTRDGIAPTVIYPTNAEVDHENRTKLAALQASAQPHAQAQNIRTCTRTYTPSNH